MHRATVVAEVSPPFDAHKQALKRLSIERKESLHATSQSLSRKWSIVRQSYQMGTLSVSSPCLSFTSSPIRNLRMPTEGGATPLAACQACKCPHSRLTAPAPFACPLGGGCIKMPAWPPGALIHHMSFCHSTLWCPVSQTTDCSLWAGDIKPP